VSREFPRSERIGAELLRELTRILSTEVRDPRLGEVTLQEVRVTGDLAHAKVYFTCFPMDEGGTVQERLLNGRLAGFLRRELARGSRLRTVPQLHFIHDVSVRHGEALSALIESAVGSSSAQASSDSTADSAEKPEQVQ
jgi:ribosome-binding factor A